MMGDGNRLTINVMAIYTSLQSVQQVFFPDSYDRNFVGDSKCNVKFTLIPRFSFGELN